MPSPQGTTLLATSGCGTATGWIPLGCCTSGDQPVFQKSNFSLVTLVTCGSPTADTVGGSFARGPTVNRVVVWRVSKIAEAEGQGNVKLLLSANPGQLCSPLHMLYEPVRGTCCAAAASVQVNLSVVSQLQKTLSALRHGKVSPLLPSNPPQH